MTPIAIRHVPVMVNRPVSILPSSRLVRHADLLVGGGINYWTVYNTGIKLAIDYAEDNKTSSASATPSSTASVIASSTVVSGGQSM